MPKQYQVIVRYHDDYKSYVDEYTLDLEAVLHTRPPTTDFNDLVVTAKEISKTMSKWSDWSSGLLVHARDKDAMLADERRLIDEQWAEGQNQAEAHHSDHPDGSSGSWGAG